MEILSAIVLGLIQGITEFLPISSSGHLIVFREILNINNSDGLAFDAILQLATTFAIIIYFRKDLLSYLKTILFIIRSKFNFNKISDEIHFENLKMFKYIIIATIPAIIFGLLLESQMETIFRSAKLVALTLIIGSIVMHYADKKSKQDSNLDSKKSFLIGLFQSLALVPGMSRSGMTISGGLFLGLKRENAARFSFILAIPILIGTGMKKLLDLLQANVVYSDFGMLLVVASVTAFVSGLLSIHFLISYLKNNDFNKFVVYRIILAICILIFF